MPCPVSFLQSTHYFTQRGSECTCPLCRSKYAIPEWSQKWAGLFDLGEMALFKCQRSRVILQTLEVEAARRRGGSLEAWTRRSLEPAGRPAGMHAALRLTPLQHLAPAAPAAALAGVEAYCGNVAPAVPRAALQGNQLVLCPIPHPSIGREKKEGKKRATDQMDIYLIRRI